MVGEELSGHFFCDGPRVLSNLDWHGVRELLTGVGQVAYNGM